MELKQLAVAVSLLCHGANFNIKSKNGKAWIDWKDESTSEPSESELQAAWDSVAHKYERQYAEKGEQLDSLWHDIDEGLFGEKVKTGSFYLMNKAVKDKSPKP